MPLTVGFDLDMTLIDPRPGMVRVFERLAADTGLPLDGERFAANLGPPLDTEFRRYGISESRVAQLVADFRALYPETVVPATKALPGAADALDAVREAGGRVIVVTAKHGPNAELHLAALGWQVNHLVGGLWSAGKALALREHGAAVYVGDHVGDVAGARAAGALSVAVASGSCGPEELAAAGAEVVLPDLVAFRAWFTTWLAARITGDGFSALNADGLNADGLNADGLNADRLDSDGLDSDGVGYPASPSTPT